MSLSEYTVPIEDGMIVKQGTQARFTVKSGRTVLEDGLTDVRYVGGAITRAGIMYNRLSYSGGVSWWNPTTGKSIKRPKVEVRVRPQDIQADAEPSSASRAE
jgi:hypothetical protein